MAVTVSDLAQLIQAQIKNNTTDQAHYPITEVGLNSSQLPSGALFAALPGTRVHGAKFAAETQAGAILTDEAGWEILSAQGESRPVLVVPDVRAVLGAAAAMVYGDPSKYMTVIGITGTSGKTTTSYMLESGLIAAGYHVGLIGTTGTRINGRPVPTSLTTPEAPTLQALFAQMLAEGVTHVVMEVSSHALMLGRVQGVKFDVAGFTNLSQDHLDFHATMEEYFDAKALFFRPGSSMRAAQAVVCVDDGWGAQMAAVFGPTAKTLTTRPQLQEADYRVTSMAVLADGGQKFMLTPKAAEPVAVSIPVPGRFNVANAALALALADMVQVPMAELLPGLASVGVPGRMEKIDCGQDFLAIVDYAHKPAAIKAVLETVRKQITGRIALVVGAGGDRDHSKRPLMGAEAAAGADYVVVTDDNPRSEDPAAIRTQVLAGATSGAAEVTEIGDRRQAIRTAVAWAQPGDAVIIAGKGHEIGQLIDGVTHHFDDREELRAALMGRDK